MTRMVRNGNIPNTNTRDIVLILTVISFNLLIIANTSTIIAINSVKFDRKQCWLIHISTSCYTLYSETQWNLHTIHQVIYLLLIHDLVSSILDAHVL